MSRESIIDKIRKLRSLAGGSHSVAEAATAARLAEELIQRHQLEEADLELTFGSTEQVLEDQQALTDWSQKQTVWQNILLTHLTAAYNCEGILKHTNGKIGFYAIGRPADISTVRYQFSFFVLELTRLAKILAPTTLERGSGKHWHKSFYLGGVRAIGDSLAKVKVEVRATANSSALTIIDRHMQESIDLRKKLYPNYGGTISNSSFYNRDAWNLGYQSGSNLNPKPGLNSNVRGLLNK